MSQPPYSHPGTRPTLPFRLKRSRYGSRKCDSRAVLLVHPAKSNLIPQTSVNARSTALVICRFGSEYRNSTKAGDLCPATVALISRGYSHPGTPHKSRQRWTPPIEGCLATVFVSCRSMLPGFAIGHSCLPGNHGNCDTYHLLVPQTTGMRETPMFPAGDKLRVPLAIH